MGGCEFVDFNHFYSLKMKSSLIVPNGTLLFSEDLCKPKSGH